MWSGDFGLGWVGFMRVRLNEVSYTQFAWEDIVLLLCLEIFGFKSLEWIPR